MCVSLCVCVRVCVCVCVFVCVRVCVHLIDNSAPSEMRFALYIVYQKKLTAKNTFL